MDITDEERHKLNNYKQVFNVSELTGQQVELILDRKVVTRKNDNIYIQLKIYLENQKYHLLNLYLVGQMWLNMLLKKVKDAKLEKRIN